MKNLEQSKNQVILQETGYMIDELSKINESYKNSKNINKNDLISLKQRVRSQIDKLLNEYKKINYAKD